MKIFSLETKKHLVGWSLGLGVILLIISYGWGRNEFSCGSYEAGVMDRCVSYFKYGWPIKFYSPSDGFSAPVFLFTSFLINYIIWILASLLILFIIRHFKYRKV